MKKLGDVASFRRGLTYAKDDVAENTTKQVLRSNNITLETSSLNFDEIVCLRDDFVIPDDKILHKDDIFICMSNGSTQHLGKVAFVSKDVGMAFGGFMGVIESNKALVVPSYVFYSCRSNAYRTYLNTIFNGANINNLKWSELSKFLIPVPPLDEQQRIVAELDLLTEVIDKRRMQLKELETLAQSIFYDMFGDPTHNEKGWDVKSLGDVCTSVSYGTSSPSSPSGRYKYLRMNNITYDGYLDLTDLKYIDMDDAEFEKYAVKEGDVLFNRTNSMDLIGKTTYIHNMEPMIIAGYIIRVRLDNSVMPVFVAKFMNTPAMKKKLRSMAKGAVNQANINSKELKSIDLIVPPIKLQQEFADKIQSIEKQKAAVNQSIAETQKLLDYTMDKYFG